MTTLTGGEVIATMLAEHGVDLGFGIGGFQALPYYDAIHRLGRIRHVLVRDEKHGAFAADAYARIARRPAVADATLGPGSTNLLSGAAESQGAGIPLLLLAGEVNAAISGRAATQESDQFAMLEPACKLAIRIDRPERIPELVRKAVNASTSGRPGPVLLDVPENVFHAQVDVAATELWADPAATRLGMRRIRPDQAAVRQAAALVREARRPLLLVGGGLHLSGAYDELDALVRLTGIPVASTISGKGAMPEDNALSAGIFGRYSRVANDLIGAADLLLVIGCKLGEIATSRWTLIPPGARIVHVDIEPSELGKVYRTELGIWADAGAFLADLTDELGADATPYAERGREQRKELGARTVAWRDTASGSATSVETPMHMARVLTELQRAMPAEGILVAEGGFATHWSALWYEARRVGRSYIANRGHAAIGYGVAGALGAKLAAPDVPVVALCGDGGFGMAIGELETLRREHTPVVLLIVNNGTLGYVKALQHGLYDGRYESVDFVDIDYGSVARAFGCRGVRVTDPARLGDALREAIEADETTVLDVMITTDPARMLPGVDARAVRGT